MEQVRTVKKIFENKPKGSGRRGRPRLIYVEDMEKDLREMKVNLLAPELFFLNFSKPVYKM